MEVELLQRLALYSTAPGDWAKFTEEELNIVLTKIKSREAVGLNKIPPEVWKAKKFDDLPL